MTSRTYFLLFACLLLALTTRAFAEQDAIGDNAQFDFHDFRIQATDQQGDLVRSQFSSGETFYIASSVKLLAPPQEDGEIDFFTTYTMTDEHGKEESQTVHSSEDIAAGQDSAFHCFGLAIVLEKNRPLVFTIESRVVFEGVSRTRTAKVTIVPRGAAGGV